jgi:nicotinamidase/pyrazinamidase
MRVTSEDVFLVVDIQNDFCPGGALPVQNGDQVIEVIQRAARRFKNIILTQDWHPPGHMSFASAHPGRKPFEIIQAPYGAQTLWPDHCIQGTFGARFHPSLTLPQAELILRKGFVPEIDSYSAFVENDRVTSTGLAGYMRERQLRRVFIAGLAYDFCVAYSSLDARRLGMDAVIVRDGCRAIDIDGSVATMESQVAAAGVTLIHSEELVA